MNSTARSEAEFRAMRGALIRAVSFGVVDLPRLPGLDETGPGAVAAWAEWLRQVWADDAVSGAISHASPGLAEQVRAVCVATDPGERETRGAMFSVVRYLVRMTGRATPYGLFAGVAAALFASRGQVCWGSRHRGVARADAGWLSAIVSRLERKPEALKGLLVAANSTLLVRGDRVVLPYRVRAGEHGTGAVEVSLRHTAAVRIALDASRAPIRFGSLCSKVEAEFPHVPVATVLAMLTELVVQGVLVTSLRAPSTEPDALGHLLGELMAVGEVAAGEAAALKEIHSLLGRHQHLPVEAGNRLRAAAADQMARLAGTPRHPVAVDLRLDARLVLPDAVAREAERAAGLLARLSPFPYGTGVWSEYHRVFYQRFGPGTLVPLLELVADSGIGWPAGYPGTSAAVRQSPRTARDDVLLNLAQRAALDGHNEVVLDEALIAQLEQADAGPVRLPPSVELCVRVDAGSLDALQRGEFRVALTSVSRGAGVMTGRFLHLLTPEQRAALIEGLLDVRSDDEVVAQLSFPPLDPATAHITRTTQVLSMVISLGEYRDASSAQVLRAGDLAVGCDSHRLYLAAPALGRRVRVCGLHALNLYRHTPPLARFLIELATAGCVQVSDFDWGAAASMAFLPRLRSGRVVLAPARWRLAAAELPGRAADASSWGTALAGWQRDRRVPSRVYLVEGDWRLPLELDLPAHQALLREHLNTRSQAVLEEAPAADAAGWCEGRAHEVVIPLTAREPDRRPRLPRAVPGRVIHPQTHGRGPGASRLLFAKLYGELHRQDTVLAELPTLLAEWGEHRPSWWFLRFRGGDGDSLRLRIALPDPAPPAFGEAAGRVSRWADGLRRAGLLREIAFATSHPQTGRWGTGEALAAAEAVFSADSDVVLAQLGWRARPHRHVLAAANLVAITTAFLGDVAAGMRWLIEHIPAPPPTTVPRPVLTQAQHLADPHRDFHALRQLPGAGAIVDTWATRSAALAPYRARLDGLHAANIDPDAVLDSLLHAHFLRACSVEAQDKAACAYLARAAALTFTARAGRR